MRRVTILPEGLKTLQRKFSYAFLATLFLVWTVAINRAQAQYNTPENSYWAFGYQSGIFFAGGLPNPVSTNIVTYEGTASMADNAGNLLFYTDGMTIYDKTGSVMPGGTDVTPAGVTTGSTTQAAIIIPVVGGANQYYVFSLQSFLGGPAPTGTCQLYYCQVDMSLNGGLGDVVPGTAGTLLADNLAEKMTAVPGDNCDIWLLVHDINQPVFYSYNISSSGISAPVVSAATGETPAGTYAYTLGAIKVSPDRKHIANCVMDGYGAPYTPDDRLELLDFAPSTGIVSGCIVLNKVSLQYDAEFSHDGHYLYSHTLEAAGSTGSAIYQYDVTVPTAPPFIMTCPDYGGQMKLGPDNKIYCNTRAGYLDVINQPWLPGPACGYVPYSLALPPTTWGFAHIGMPNIALQSPAGISGTLHLCGPGTTTLSGTPSGGTWSSSDPGVAAIDLSTGVVTGYTTGSTTIIYTTPAGCTATAVLTITPPCPPPTGLTYLCSIGETTILNDAVGGGTWSSSDPTVAIVDPTGVVTATGWGTATITYTIQGGCYGTITVTVNNIVPPITGPTTVFCTDPATTTLHDDAPGGTWSGTPGTVDPITGDFIVSYAYTGTAIVTYTLPGGCMTTTTVTFAPPGPPPPVTCYAVYDYYTYGQFLFYITAPAGATVYYDLSIFDLPSAGMPFTLPQSLYFPTSSTQLIALPVTYGSVTYSSPPYAIVSVHVTGVQIGACKWDVDCFSSMSKSGQTSGSGMNNGSSNDLSAELQVHPNPNSGQFTLSGDLPDMAASNEVTVEVVDMLSKVLYTEKAPINNGKIEKNITLADNVANGVYLIKVKNETISKVLRFTLER